MMSSIVETTGEQQLILPGCHSWQQFKTLQIWVEEIPGLKVSYVDGYIQFMTTSRQHERIKKLIAILLEVYFFEMGIPFFPVGNATCEAEERGASFSPDESYCFGEDKPYPDLAIEVVFTSGGIDTAFCGVMRYSKKRSPLAPLKKGGIGKSPFLRGIQGDLDVPHSSENCCKLEKYRRFRIPEVWFWQNDRLSLYLLRSDLSGYDRAQESQFLPDLDLSVLAECMQIPDILAARQSFLKRLGDRQL